MTEDNRQKEIRLKKELAQVKAMNANADAKLKPSRDFSVGVPKDTSVKKSPHSADNPDVILLPPKRRGKKENIPF
tara:strand:- start:880 stop:1104 length:225 start_codon:yes stop_codon:yes gene_type:complete